MAPIWRRSSSTTDEDAARREAARAAARAAAIQRRDICLQIRAYLATLYPTYPNLTVRSQLSAGTTSTQPCYVALVLYETAQSSRLSAANPVIGYVEEYYDDRVVAEEDLARYTILLNGTPGTDQTEGLARLLERVEVLVRSGWRAE